ncbi:MAG TPA: hypothetical protein VFS76_06635 [Pyrinomonadaceae bacterium]|nr:hypothetical protein [Pyrinomonadaceae bacterium]
MNGERALTLDRLYRLMPVVYRQRDEELGGALRDLLRVISEQVNVVEENILQLYENWFIETCQDWTVPYIGELIGYTPVHEAGEPGRTPADQPRNRILIPRREVATTIQSRRRRGTLALLEELARNTAGWPSRAVEFSRFLSVTPAINSSLGSRGRLPDLRQAFDLDLLDSPFERLAHTPDVRRIGSSRGGGRYNLPAVGLFVWRLNEYSVTNTQAACLEDDGLPFAYTFSFLGNDTPLFARTQPETDPTHIADEENLPVRIRRLAFERHPDRYYGEGKSLRIWTGISDDNNGLKIEAVPLEKIKAANLSDWNRYRTPHGYVAVDPELGRIAFHPDESPRGIWVSYYYGFSADIGGGEYRRPIHQPAQSGRFSEFDFKGLASLAKQFKTPASPLNVYLTERLSQESKDLLEQYDESDPVPENLRKSLVPALVEDLNRALFDEDLYDQERFPEIDLNAELTNMIARLVEGKLEREELARLNRSLLQLAYPDEIAEYLRLYHVGEGQPLANIERALDEWMKDAPRNAIIEIHDNGVYSEPLDIRLNRGQSLQIRAVNGKRPIIYLHEQYKNRPEWLAVKSKTGGCLTLDGLLVTGRSMRVEGAVEQVQIRHCTFVPGWGIGPGCDPKRPAKPSLEFYKADCRVNIEHSIVGSIQVFKDEVRTDPLELNISDSIVDATTDEREAIGAPNWPRAHVDLRMVRSTIIGEVEVNAILLASDCIFTGTIKARRRQIGCMRFCYVPPGSRTPRRYHCQPDLVEAAVKSKYNKPEQAEKRIRALRTERIRVEPRFNSKRYGRPEYCQLAADCAQEITQGASDQSEMGVFHDLFQPQRAANLRVRLEEFMPAGSEAGIIFAS